MKNRFREIFYYSRRQRRALLVLYSLCLLLVAAQIYLGHFVPLAKLDQEELDLFITEWRTQDSLLHIHSTPHFKPFAFDPNLASDSIFAALGMPKKIIGTIMNYRRSGGRFKVPEDLMNIYGMDSSIYNPLRDHVHISRPSINQDTPASDSRDPLQLSDSFDPNLVSRSELEGMGLRGREIKGIIGFRTKFRPFKSSDDLFQVYNLDSARVLQLMPFVVISTSVADSTGSAESKLVDINHADSITMLQLKGVGPYFAGRIVSYRQRLGGYANKAQLLEIYGLDSNQFHQISGQIEIDGSAIVRMDLNTASFGQLLRHPYLNLEQVKSIIQFREEYRQFEHVDELMNLELINGVLFSKIANYLTVDKKEQ